jgi:hypothetical protein
MYILFKLVMTVVQNNIWIQMPLQMYYFAPISRVCFHQVVGPGRPVFYLKLQHSLFGPKCHIRRTQLVAVGVSWCHVASLQHPRHHRVIDVISRCRRVVAADEASEGKGNEWKLHNTDSATHNTTMTRSRDDSDGNSADNGHDAMTNVIDVGMGSDERGWIGGCV